MGRAIAEDETEASDEFPVEWDNPADAKRTWAFDLAHTPDVVTPLGFDLYYGPFLRGFGLGVEARRVNCYVFMGRDTDGQPIAMPPVDLAWLRQAGERWRQEIIPEVVRHTEYYREADFDACSNQDLIGELDKLREVRVRQGELHTQAMFPWMMCMNHLADVHRELTGGDDVSAMRLVQGYGNKSVEAGKELWKLSKLAASIPSVHKLVLEVTRHNAAGVMSSLEADGAAAPFREAFASFLAAYGWRADLFELASRTWAEDPTIPLCQLRAYVELDGYDPEAELRRLAGEREEAIQRTLGALDADAKEQLRGVIDVAAELISIQEDHNFYIDQRLAYMPRRLVLAAGRRLVASGAIADPSDSFYLHAEELRSSLAGARDGVREVADRRRAEMAKWSTVTPPDFIGAPPDGDEAFIRRFQGTPRLQSDRPNELAGNSASAGVARGPARVLMSLAEVDRLGRGDVLVARTTMPAWTPLFAVAAAVVTESGGVLSHAAVVAREYGLPAVLSVRNATRLIRDGQLVEVDGDEGVVRMLS